MNRRMATALLGLGLLTGVVACGSDSHTATPGSGTAPPGAGGDSAIPVEVVDHAADWPLPNRDYANSRATTDSSIDSTNVASLEVAWKAELSGTGTFGNASTTPIIVGDTVYLEDLSSKVMALDRSTGTVRWTTDLSDDGAPVIGPNGVAVADGKVFAIAGAGSVAALDMTTGAVVWKHKVADTPTTGVDIQPTVYHDLVYVSTVPISISGVYHGGDRGIIKALRVDDGSEAWAFDTVGSPDLWGDPAVNSGGGAWYPPTIDTGTGMMFWGTGNPAPFPGTPSAPDGSSRPGPNPYTNGTLALGAADGAMSWFQQAIAHDIFDHDHQLTMMATTPDGPMLIGTGKDGLVFGLDPTDGTVRWKTPVGLHQNDDATTVGTGITVLPGNLGGVETPPATADGIVYLPVVNEPATYENVAGTLGNGTVGTMDGEIVALDAATGQVKWDAKVPGDPFGGATVVNDVVFTGLHDGTLLALSTVDGHQLWSYPAGGTINAWPAVAGDLLIWPLGGSTPPMVLAMRPKIDAVP